MRKSTECTGLRRDHHDSGGHRDAGKKIERKRLNNHPVLPVGCIGFNARRQFRFPPVTVSEKFAFLSCSNSRVSAANSKLVLPQWHRPDRPPGRSHNRCTSPCRCRNGLCGGYRHPGFSLDGDRLRRAHSFTEFAGNAAFFSTGIAAQCMFSPEARAQWPFSYG